MAEPNAKAAINGLDVILAISDAIRDLKEVPSGHLYARVMFCLDIHGYNAIIQALVNAGLVRKSAHLLTWIGPAAPTKAPTT